MPNPSPLVPEPVRAPPLAETVAAHLERMILEGALRPGERLAAERDLAERLGVSRPSLREAMAILERKGLLSTGRGGAAVAPFLAGVSDPLAALLRGDDRAANDYFEVRRLVEPMAAALAAQRATEPDRAALREAVAAIEAAHGADDPAAEAAADTRLHLAVHEASHNLVLLHMLRVLGDLLRDGILADRARFFGRPAVRDALLAQHRAVAAAILAGDAAAAERAMRDHLAFTATVFAELREEEARLTVSRRKQGRRDLLAAR